MSSVKSEQASLFIIKTSLNLLCVYLKRMSAIDLFQYITKPKSFSILNITFNTSCVEVDNTKEVVISNQTELVAVSERVKCFYI